MILSREERILPDGDKVDLIIRDSLTVEDVYDHLIHGRIYQLVAGEKKVNVDGIEEVFLEELRWPRM